VQVATVTSRQELASIKVGAQKSKRSDLMMKKCGKSSRTGLTGTGSAARMECAHLDSSGGKGVASDRKCKTGPG
jgi:hypothetical protein